MTIDEAITWGKSVIESESPVLDVELLLCDCLDKPRSYLFTWPEKILTEQQSTCFTEQVKKRQAGVPIAHLIGEREFWGMPFKVTPDTLIPRPDTEILVEQALVKLETLKASGKGNIQVVDLGTGSGAIICALKKEQSDIKAHACDQSPQALAVAKQNAALHLLDIQFHLGSWLEPLVRQTFDMIITNPPYIETNDPHLAQGDVRFEPITALTSGTDGLDDIRQIIQQSSSHLNTGGWLLIEHGYQQAEAVKKLLASAGFEQIETHDDYGHNPRVTLGCYPAHPR